MQEFKGTKGAWYAQQGVDQMVSDDTTVFTNLGDYWHIFSTAPKKGDIKANVQLIASAPELLEALFETIIDLKILKEQFEHYNNKVQHSKWEGMDKKIDEWLNRNQKAINKALGK